MFVLPCNYLSCSIRTNYILVVLDDVSDFLAEVVACVRPNHLLSLFSAIENANLSCICTVNQRVIVHTTQGIYFTLKFVFLGNRLW